MSLLQKSDADCDTRSICSQTSTGWVQTSFEDGKDEEKTIFTANWLLSHLDIHGLSTWVETNKSMAKITWGSVIFLAFLALCYGLYKSIDDYKNNPILTTYSIVPQQAMPLPDIFICPTNFINQSAVMENHTDLFWAHYYWQDGPHEEEHILAEKSSLWEKLLPQYTIARPETMEPNDFQEFIMSLGYGTDQFFKECKFGNRIVDCAEITEPVFDKDHGKCFLISQHFSQTVPGIGLSLVLNIHTSESPDPTFVKYHPPLFDGVYVSIAKKFCPAFFDKILVGPGSLTKLSLTTTKIELLNIKDQKCADSQDAETTDNFEVLRTDYSPEACQMECVQKLVRDKCNCLLAMDQKYLKDTNYSICHPAIMKNCTMVNVVKYAANISACNKQCVPACETWDYKHDISSFKFPSKALRDKRNGPLKHRISAWMNDYILLDIAFKKLHYDEISQSASMTFDTFISNLGGQMGIWLGASLLTAVQASMLFISFCFGRLFQKTV